MLSRVFLIKQKKCCGRGCLMCPYTLKHSGESITVRPEVIQDLKVWELTQLDLTLIKLKN